MSYKPVADDVKVAILRTLVEGTPVRAAATALALDPHVVTRVASAHGYPDRHKVAWAADVIEKGRDVVSDEPVDTAPAPASTPRPRPQAPATPPVTAPTVGDLASLLARGGKSGKARTRALAKRIAADVGDLRGRLTAEEEAKRAADVGDLRGRLTAEEEAKRAAAEEAAAKAREKSAHEREQKRIRAEVAALEAKLAKLRAGLAKSQAATSTPSAAALGLDPKAVRRWASENGVACTTTGKVPKVVLAAYVEAHTQDGAA